MFGKIRSSIIIIINNILRLISLKLIRIEKENKLYDDKYSGPSFSKSRIPEDVKEYLNTNNEYLIELKRKYSKLNLPVTSHSFWSEKTMNSDEFDIKYFRGDNVFLWQYRSVGSEAELKYLLYTYYIRELDKKKLLEKLKEDDLFGVYIFNYDDKLKISRDLLDSISEIYFLDEHLNLYNHENLKILDIGAGYGRFAYRMIKAFSKIENFFCVDAVAESTFICDFYLRFRGVNSKVKTIPLYEINERLMDEEIFLVTNIHSFSECTFDAIKWWLDFIIKKRIKYFFLVPNPTESGKLLSTERNGNSIEYLPEILSRGYKLIAKKSKFTNKTLQTFLHHTPVYYYLFELEI